jgi:hypothetical protein
MIAFARLAVLVLAKDDMFCWAFGMMTMECYHATCPYGPYDLNDSAVLEALWKAIGYLLVLKTSVDGISHKSKAHPLWNHLKSSYNSKTLQEILHGTKGTVETFTPEAKLFMFGVTSLLVCLPQGYKGSFYAVVASAFGDINGKQLPVRSRQGQNEEYVPSFAPRVKRKPIKQK